MMTLCGNRARFSDVMASNFSGGIFRSTSSGSVPSVSGGMIANTSLRSGSGWRGFRLPRMLSRILSISNEEA